MTILQMSAQQRFLKFANLPEHNVMVGAVSKWL
jgi:hypothetical protein